MGLPNVSVQLLSGGLGRVLASDDRVVALVINGVTDTPLQIFSLEDAHSHATTANASYGEEYIRQLTAFYTAAGEGAELWVQAVAPTTLPADLFGPTGIVAGLITAAQGRISVIGVSRLINPAPGTIAHTSGLDTDTVTSLPLAQALADSFALQHMPFRVILDGKNFDGNAGTLMNLKTGTYNRVGVCLAAQYPNTPNSSMGLLLGRIASIPVNRNIGRVKDGATPAAGAYLTDFSAVVAGPGRFDAIADKGYIFLRKLIGKAGAFWSDDHMACADTDDYYSLSNGRVIDKVARIVYQTYLNELLDSVTVDADTGKILPTVLKHYQGEAEQAVNLTMTAAGEISGVKCFIDPSQNILATGNLYIDVRIIPTGTNRAITVRLGLYNPLAN